jgi:hypothetical protein
VRDRSSGDDHRCTDVEVHGEGVQVHVDILESGGSGIAGMIPHVIQGPELRSRPFHGIAGKRVVGEIPADRDRLGARPQQLLGHAGGRRFVAVDDRHGGAFPCKQQGASTAHAGRGGGYQSRPTGKSSHFRDSS